MKRILIEEEIRRHAWALTETAMEAILSVVDGGHLSSDDEPKFHGALAEIGEKVGRLTSDGYNYSRKDGNIGIVRIEGPLVPRASWMTDASGLTSTELLGADLARMERDPQVEKVALIVDSPGGAVTGISEVAAQIASMSKPVYSYAAGLSASAAYWISSASDKAFASDTAIIGSIGTVMTRYKNADDTRIIVKSRQSPKKHLEPDSEEGMSEAQSLVDDLSSVFIDTVAKNRGTTAEDVMKNYGQGGVMIASKAEKAGMIDKISTFSEFMWEFSAEPLALCGAKKKAKRASTRMEGTGVEGIVCKKEIDNPSSSVLTIKQEGEAVAPKKERKMSLKEYLASNPEHRAEFDAAISEARKEATAAVRLECSRAVKIAASASYPQRVKDLAGEVVEGTKSLDHLNALVDYCDMESERSKSQSAKETTEQVGPTPTENAAASVPSSDGKIRTIEDAKAALERIKG